MRSLYAALTVVALAVTACAPPAPSSPTSAPAATAAPAKPTSVDAEPGGGASSLPPPPVTPLPTPRPGEPRSTPYISNVLLPANLRWAPDGRLFFVEVANGTIRVANNGVLQEQPFATIKIARQKETGVLGLALDPNFAQNHYVYVYFTAPGHKDEPREQRVERFTDRNGIGEEQTLIMEDIPVGICCHNGGRLGFGPDGKLYITVGDMNERRNVQNPRRLHGKILRVNPDGSIPDDNPVAGSPVFATGFRNPWGLDFHPLTGRPYASENGPDEKDEINLIMPGGNYGHPEVEGRGGDPRYLDPVWESGSDRIAPTGMAFYRGDLMPQYKNDLLFCAYNSASLMHMRLGGPNLDQVQLLEPLAENCHLDVANGPDGAVYTSSITGIWRYAP